MTYDQSLGEKIRELRDLYGYTTSQIGIKLGKSRSLISMWESNTRKPDYEDIRKLANIFEVTTDYLVGKTTVPNAEVKTVSELKIMQRRIHVYGSIPAGIPIEAIEDIIDEVSVPDWLANKKDLFGLIIVGESMNKVVPNGAIGVFEKTTILENGEIGAILVNGHDATVKKFYRLTDSYILEPLSHDTSFEPTVIKYGSDEVSVIGKLVWFCAPRDF